MSGAGHTGVLLRGMLGYILGPAGLQMKGGGRTGRAVGEDRDGCRQEL